MEEILHHLGCTKNPANTCLVNLMEAHEARPQARRLQRCHDEGPRGVVEKKTVSSPTQLKGHRTAKGKNCAMSKTFKKQTLHFLQPFFWLGGGGRGLFLLSHFGP